MTPITRRVALQALALAATAAAARPAGSQAQAPLTISILAQRFQFTPREITVQAGQPVVLEVKSLDYEHGLSLPQLRLRIDLVPDRVVRLAIPPQPAGNYGFLCDNFCGEDHEDMHGRLVVTNPA